MKTILPIVLAMTLMTLLAFNVGAQSFGSDENLIPYLNFTLSADDYTIHAPPIESSGGQFTSWVSSPTGRIDDVSILAGNITLSDLGNYTVAESEVYYDFLDSTVGGEDYRPSVFQIEYSPFTIKYGDAFQDTNISGGARLDSFTLYEAIGAYYEWYGGGTTAYVEGEVVFRVNYVYTQLADVPHSVYKYQPLTAKYSVSFGNEFDGSFNASSISLADMTFRNETENITMTYYEFCNDIRAKTGVMRNFDNQNNLDDLWLDVESCEVRINAVNAPFAGIIQPYAPYIDGGGYDYVNGLAWSPEEEVFSYRQQHMSLYNALVVANKMNQNQLDNIGFEDSNNPIVRVPALFLNAVSAFFDIDFFGLGFTIGNIIGVFALAVMVVIFLRLFAGG